MTTINTLKAHLAINVKNVDASIDFYKKMLGIDPSKVRIGYAKFDIQNPPLNLTLNQNAFSGQGALSHLGIQVGSSEDVAAMRDLWTKRGLTPREEMQTSCCYALQDKAWVNDPDGNEWEVFTVLKDNLGEEEVMAEGSTCCSTPPAEAATERQEVKASCCG